MRHGCDVLAMGRAIVDVVASVDDEVIRSLGLRKGELFDLPSGRLEGILGRLPPHRIQPGGSVSNTLGGLTALGADTTFLGVVACDAAGMVLRDDFAARGIAFPNRDRPAGPASRTSTFFLLKSPDGTETMGMCHGVGDQFSRADLFPDRIRAARLVYVEANVLCSREGAAAGGEAIDIARAANRPVMLTLQHISQSCARLISERHAPKADYIVGNEDEFQRIFGVTRLDRFVDGAGVVAMTEGARGVTIAGRGEHFRLPPHRPGVKGDTLGLGDAWVAGFTRGILYGRSLAEAGAFGNETADRMLDVPNSARPPTDWAEIDRKYAQGFPIMLGRSKHAAKLDIVRRRTGDRRHER